MSEQHFPMKIGVVGSRGRLGAIILCALERLNGVDVIAIEALPDGLDAVINTAPLPNADLHRLALKLNCHVVDVTIDGRLIREMLTLHSLAQQQERCLIAMVGLAPGLTGLHARQMLTSTPNSEKVHVSLLQNSSGTAGRKGTLDMVNLLTDPMCIYKSRPYPHRFGNRQSTRKMFDFYTPELEFMAEANRIRFVTGFENGTTNSAMAALAVVRRLLPPIYRRIRDTVVDAKARTSEATSEEIELGAIVFVFCQANFPAFSAIPSRKKPWGIPGFYRHNVSRDLLRYCCYYLFYVHHAVRRAIKMRLRICACFDALLWLRPPQFAEHRLFDRHRHRGDSPGCAAVALV